MKKIFISICFSLLILSCSSEPDIPDEYLDGHLIEDPSIMNPENYLLSYQISSPSDIEKQLPVCIAVHGYTATTFEWDEFREYIPENMFTSQVLLGGHGRTYKDFRASTWEDWQSSIIEEYERLVDLGYLNISIAASSTGCPLVLDLISKKYFRNKQEIKNFFFIDPIIIPSNKTLSIVKLLGIAIAYIEPEFIDGEEKYWYVYRPQETLNELNHLTQKVRKELEDGIKISNESKVFVYKSIKDESADPVSAVLLYKGLKSNNSDNINVKMIESDLHVFTRLDLRENLSEKDVKNQEDTFNEMIDVMIK